MAATRWQCAALAATPAPMSEPVRCRATMRRPRVHAEEMPRSKGIRGGWVLEALGIFVILYPVFSWARNLFPGTVEQAFANAAQVLRWEQRIGIDWELAIQGWFLPYSWAVAFWNVWYGTAHFVAPVVAFVLLYRRDPARYLRWRDTFLWMLLPVVIGFSLFPLAPPRLLPSSFGFVETTDLYFAFGKPAPHSGEGMALYAAMPSMHIAFATWVALGLWPVLRSWPARIAIGLYPIVMFTATVVTANHFVLDGVGSWIALAIGYVLASWRRWMPRRRPDDEIGEPARPEHADVVR